MYNKITNKDILFFESILNKENIIIKADELKEYSKDELGKIIASPEIVLLVENSNEISLIMEYANEHNIPVVVRGSGTGLVGGCVPLYGGIVLSTIKMNHILELDEENLTLTVECGVLLKDIYSFLEEKGYFYAPDPGEKTATIGGNVQTNAGGMRAIKYGTTRDWVRGIEVVLPNGEVEVFGGKIVKDSTGYSLKNLLIGSEGTLGIVTKIILKIIAKPLETISLLVPFSNVKDCLKIIPNVIKSSPNIIALEFFENRTMKLSEKFLDKTYSSSNDECYLLLSYTSSSKDEIHQLFLKESKMFVDELGALDVYMIDNEHRKKTIWKIRESFLESIKASTYEMDECDVVVPIAKIESFLSFASILENKFQVRIPNFGHAGDGNLHLYVCKDHQSNTEFRKTLDDVFKELYNKADEFGGRVSGEHGIGFTKKEYMISSLGKTQIELMKGIKKVFDPNNILNPGKLF